MIFLCDGTATRFPEPKWIIECKSLLLYVHSIQKIIGPVCKQLRLLLTCFTFRQITFWCFHGFQWCLLHSLYSFSSSTFSHPLLLWRIVRNKSNSFHFLSDFLQTCRSVILLIVFSFFFTTFRPSSPVSFCNMWYLFCWVMHFHYYQLFLHLSCTSPELNLYQCFQCLVFCSVPGEKDVGRICD